ncbi:unnamed protein product [Ranitomeya imitator]|uniref:Cell cycle regulator of non-homologous end joining n=1 Tax=Ranitomeya imitator TaxID=111125 RepID=A0ABN9LSX6_9NEOB|nr:unnamed protein product [Ranitomeya imitator]
MDAAGSAVKRRLLPSWMTDDNSAPKKPHSAEPRRRKTQVSVSSRKRTVYCMNERELVECALEVLSQVLRREGSEPLEGAAVHNGVIGVTTPRLQQGALPYIMSKVQREEEKSKNEAASPSAGREETPPTAAGSEKPRTKPPSCNDSDDPDDDPLKYVREIFFS